ASTRPPGRTPDSRAVVDQVELHDRLARLLDAVGLGQDDHPVDRRRVAGDRGSWRLLDVHHAEAALPGDREAGMVTVVRDLDADLPRRLDQVRSGRNLDRVAVDRQVRHAAIWVSGPRTRP